jgi:hypothetical protein
MSEGVIFGDGGVADFLYELEDSERRFFYQPKKPGNDLGPMFGPLFENGDFDSINYESRLEEEACQRLITGFERDLLVLKRIHRSLVLTRKLDESPEQKGESERVAENLRSDVRKAVEEFSPDGKVA